MKTSEGKSLKPVAPPGGRGLWAEGRLAWKSCFMNKGISVWGRIRSAGKEMLLTPPGKTN